MVKPLTVLLTIALASSGLSGQAQSQSTALPAVVVTAPKFRPSTPRLPAVTRAPVRTATRAAPTRSNRAAAAPAHRIIASSPRPPGANALPLPGTISSEVVAREQPTTLGAALSERPGAASSSYAPGGADRPILRGLDNNRIRLQENGLGAHDISALGEDHAVPINPLVQDRIEVIRGPEALRYGSQAVAGIVNAENNRIPTFIPQGGYAGRVLSGYATNGNGRDVAASVDAGAGNVAIHADGYRQQSDDYGTPRGRQSNSASRHEGGAVGISWIGENGFVGIGASHSSSLYGIPGGEAAASRTRLDPVQDKLYAKGEVRFEHGPFEAFRFWLGASRYRHDETGLDDEGRRGVRATFRNREVEARAELQHVPVVTTFGRLTGLVGIQTGRARLGTAGEAGGLLAPASTRQLSGYVFEQLDLGGGLRFQGSGRIEGARIAGTASFFPGDYVPNEEVQEPFSSARRREFTAKSAAFGLLQNLPHGFVGALTGLYSERAPTAAELYSRGPHEATATFEIGDPSLKLERAKTIELSLKRSMGAFRLDAAAYYTRYDGFIAKRFTGANCDDEFATCGTGEELRQVVFNQRDATFWGTEIAGQLDVLPLGVGMLGVEGRYDFVHASFDKGGPVPRIAPHRLGGGVYWQGGGWLARMNLLHAFDQNRVSGFETRTKGWDNLRAELSYTRAFDRRIAGVSEVTLGLRGENLLDDDLRNATSFRKDVVLMPGRNVRLFMSAKF